MLTTCMESDFLDNLNEFEIKNSLSSLFVHVYVMEFYFIFTKRKYYFKIYLSFIAICPLGWTLYYV